MVREEEPRSGSGMDRFQALRIFHCHWISDVMRMEWASLHVREELGVCLDVGMAGMRLGSAFGTGDEGGSVC